MTPTVGLLSYNTYLPYHALSRAAIGEALGGKGGKGSRSVAGYDEDAITMAVAAVRGLQIADPSNAGTLYFASASAPFLDKTNADVVQAATLGLEGSLNLDLTGLRSGFGALQLAARTGGIAALSDLRSGRPGSSDELEGGDGAAAFLFGEATADTVATVVANAHISLELMDSWRVPGNDYGQVWEERFAGTIQQRAVKDVLDQLTTTAGITETPTVTLISAPNRRFAATAAAAVGSIGGISTQENHRERIGYCGAAEVGLLLADALDTAKAGDRVALVSVSGGVDALLIEVLRDGPGARPELPRGVVSYNAYLTWRGTLVREPARRPDRPSVSAPAAYRNQAWKYRMEGSRCTDCGKIYLPAQRVCGQCGSVDADTAYAAADRIGHIVSWSTDGVTDTPAPPAMAAIVDFDGGGRILAELTDCAPTEVEVGTPVVMTFRRTYAVRGVPNYFWKATPAKETI